MRKLLSANFSRLWKNKAFWSTVIFMAVLQQLISLQLISQSAPLDITLFISLEFIGIISSVFFGLFLGTEYSDGTIRNKIIAGHKRRNIYLASFFTGCIAMTTIYLSSVLGAVATGMLMHAAASQKLSVILLSGGIGWLASLSYVSIFNFIGFLSSSKARTSIICIMTAFVLIITGTFCFSLLSDGQNAWILFLYEYNPFGQTIQVMSMNLPQAEKYACYALSLSCIMAALGIFLFQRKDLK